MVTLSGLTIIFFLTLSASKAQNPIGKQRYAILQSFSGSGIHNVRYETMPNNFVDKEGKEVANTANSHKGADGKDVYDCIDVMGVVKAHGTEYERPNGRFKYRCNNGIEEVAACVGSKRTNKAIIKVGDTHDVNGFWHKCEQHPNKTVIYTEEPTCTVKNKEYHIGDEIQGAFIRMICKEDGYKIVGCYYLKGKEVVKMEPDTKAVEGDVEHHCEDNDGNIKYYAQVAGCTKNGKKYKDGDVFKANHLKYKCDNGMTDIEGCYIDEQRNMNVGQDIVEDKMVYRCYRIGGKVSYEEYACGMNKTPSCKPEPIPKTSDDVPKLGHGLKSPGFSSFSVVESIGPEKLAGGSNAVKLDLNKLLMSSQGSH
ncbi:hypothetical protein L596_016882 [Steinernema carpocapsae]|uniref:Abnormal cell migration protein 18-like fibronectin type I domain-containing protein n=1 Tax=Steinernema carpocapsae TaxID=34508 RepID=A0A4U5NKM6_STECR|nr:hypothetical protein L596_016882 [Steinernema carpocapsae]